MRRRSRAGGEPTKSQLGKAASLKRRNAPKSGDRHIAPARQDSEIAWLTCELKEAREQQAATGDVLKVISRSTFDLQTVLNTLAQSAGQLCEAYDSIILLPHGKTLRVSAHHGPIPSEDVPIGRGHVAGRAFIDRTLLHINDLKAAAHEFPDGSKAALRLGHRTILAVPLLRQNAAIGVLAIRRLEVKPFTDKQIELVQNFAAQAVIAIENTRLLNELRQRTADLSESLEQQTASAEVLKVISSSPGELKLVFQSMLTNATRLCQAKFGTLYLYDEGRLRFGAAHDVPPAFAEARGKEPMTPAPDTSIGKAVATKQAVQIDDLAATQSYSNRTPTVVAAVEMGGVRTVISVPMLKEDALVGVISIYRKEVRPFTDKQTALLQNFAAQAVIAIENARLLNELRGTTDQLKAQSQQLATLNKQLEQRVADQVGEIERMGRLRRFLPPQVADLIVASGAENQLESHRREITALFCDLRGFTGFSESSDPEDVMALLSDYHAAIGKIIIKYSGTLERYAGDGVMVVFNDPVPVENPALQAVLMALEMRDAIGALTETWHRWGHDISFGIGIAHGFATLGTIGFEGRFDYAAIGTVSNVASRLCDEAKPGQILIAPRVLTKVENAVTVEPVSEFALKGIRRPMMAYNVLQSLPSKPN